MRSFFTKLFFASLITFGLVQFSNAQVYIWGGPGDVNSEFANGLNDWTTTDEGGVAWVWDANGMADEGTYWGTRGAIGSASVANGVACFNSDKFHSIDGIGYPHLGELTSPAFSTEGHSTVVVRFDQDIRFWDPGNASLIQVSTDGGANWLPQEGIEVNPDMPGNWNIAVDPGQTVKLIDITEYAADQASVQFRFVWNGSYYFWLIDDVFVIEKPEVELGILATLYDPIAAQFPLTQGDARSSNFEVDITNGGSTDVMDGVVGINVTDDNGNILYQDSISGVEMLAGDTSNFVFTNQFIPTTTTFTNEGYHYFDYWTYAPGATEFKPADNLSSEAFYLTDGRYDNAFSVGTGYTSTIGSFGAISIFPTGSWADIDEGYTFVTDSVRLQVVDNNDLDDFTADVNVFLYKVDPSVDPLFENFDTAAFAQFDPNEDAHPNLELIGFGFETSYQGLDYEDFKVGLYDMDFNERVVLEPSSRYILMAYWDNEETLYHGIDDEKFFNGMPTCGWYRVSEDGGDWDFAPWYGWRLSMETQYVVGTEDVKLPENTLTVYPNPANDLLNIDIQFDTNIEEGNLILTDINNRYVNSIMLKDFSTSRENMNVLNVPSGNYILRLVTKDGVAEKKVIIQH